MRRFVLSFAVVILLSTCGASAQSVVPPMPEGVPGGPVSQPVPGGGWFGPSAGERVQEEVQKGLEKWVAEELGPGFGEYLGPDKIVLERMWAVCPDTFAFLKVLPKTVQPQIVREVVVRARTKRLLEAGFQPHLRGSFPIMRNPLGLDHPDWRRDYLLDHGINADPATDDPLLEVAKKRFLTLNAIPDGLQPVLIKETDDWGLLNAVEIFVGWPHLATAVLQLSPSVQAHAIALLNIELPTAYSSLEAEPERSWAANEAERTRLTKLITGLMQDDKTWPGVVRELANKLKGSMVFLHGSPTRRRLNCLVAHEDVLTAYEIEVPPWKLLKSFGIEKRVVAKDFEKLVGTPRPDQPILFLGGGSDYSTHDLLPGRLTARSFDDSLRFSDLHVENFRQLTNRDLAPAKTILFNLIPESLGTIRRIGLPGSGRRWRRARRTYEEFARQRGLILGDGGSREKLLAALRDEVLDTIVIVAHGETDGIYLADGSKISVDDILDLPALDSARKPIVVLVSCATGRFDRSLRSMAQALLLRGRASAVLAPTQRVPVFGGTVRFLKRLLSSESRPAATAFKHLAGPWQLYVERHEGAFLPRISPTIFPLPKARLAPC